METSREKILPSLLIVILIFLLMHIAVYVRGIKDKELVDTDNYMRLVRVEQLAETGQWYDSVIHRSNYPYGDELHWTRPLDVMLLAGAYLLTPFVGFHKGLLDWGIIISPLFGICCLLALIWAARSVMNRNSQRLLLLLFIAQPLLIQIFLLGRPDHHSLLMLLFILLLGCLFRMAEQPDNDRNTLISGLIASFSFWVSVETIFTIIVVYITLAVLWLIRRKEYSRQLLLFSLSIFASLSIFLFIERPLSSIFAVEYDKISIVHLFVFALAISATYLLTLIKSTDLIPKLVKSGLVLAVCGFIIWLVFPDYFQGPMAGINKAIVPIWLSKVREVQPLWSIGPIDLTTIAGSSIVFLGYLTYLIVKKKFKSNFNFVLPIIIGFAIFLPLGIYQIRMDYYLVVIIIMLLAVLLDDILARISNSDLSTLYKPLLRVIVMLIFILGLPGVGILVSLQQPSKTNSNNIPDLKAMSVFLNNYQKNDPQAKTILTFLDFGPELLYRTNYNLISTPYHRNDQGILFNYQVMAVKNLNQAQEMLDERSVDLLILDPKSSERGFYKKTADHSTLYERLIAGEKPAFLKKVNLPPHLAKIFKVYRIIN